MQAYLSTSHSQRGKQSSDTYVWAQKHKSHTGVGGKGKQPQSGASLVEWRD